MVEIKSHLLRQAYDYDWYYPYRASAETLALPEYQRAVEEGWHEWIESDLDVEAIKQGYRYDVSYDVDGNPCCFLDGKWVLHDGTEIEVEDEQYHIGHVGSGDAFLRLCETFLTLTKGLKGGEPYRFIPWARKLSTTVMGWVDANGNRRYRHCVIFVPKKNAKLLADSTPIPTPNGWTTHGQLKVGDKLFAGDGSVCEVVAVHPKDVANRRVEFTNGEVIYCNDDHLWVTQKGLQLQWAPEVRSTRDIRATLHEGHKIKLPSGAYVNITSITDSDPQQGNCITVSSKDGTYLAGRTMIPTHNSALMSNFAIYMLAFDGTKRAQVYGAACDRNQARIIYDDAASMVKASPVLEDMIHVVDSKSRLVHQASGSFYVVLSADAHRNEGIDASCVLVDEIHVHPNRKLYSVLKRSGQARANPLMFVISTVGSSLDESIWAELFKEGKAQLAGERPDSIHHYTMIASAAPIKVELKQDAKQGDTILHVNRLEQPVDCEEIEFELVERKIRAKIVEPAKRFQDFLVIEPLEADVRKYSQAEANRKWDTDHAIIRANPSVGFTFQLERLRQEIKDARTPAALAEMQQLNLNIVSGVGKGIVSQAAWQACGELPFNTAELLGRPCYGGADISFKNDLTSFSLAFPNWEPWVKFGNVEDPMLHTLNWSWVPEEGIEHREELEQVAYRAYSKIDYVIPGKGCIRLCKGSVIDYAQVAADIIEICKLFKIRPIALDPNYSQFLAPLLEQAGLTIVAHRQNAMHMSPPIKRFAEIVHKTQLAHGKHPILTQSIANAVLSTPDASGNQMLAKTKSHGRIDPLVATVMAVGFATNPPQSDDAAWSDASTGMWG